MNTLSPATPAEVAGSTTGCGSVSPTWRPWPTGCA